MLGGRKAAEMRGGCGECDQNVLHTHMKLFKHSDYYYNHKFQNVEPNSKNFSLITRRYMLHYMFRSDIFIRQINRSANYEDKCLTVKI